MSSNSNQSRQRREPLSPKTILARVFAIVVLIAMLFAVFVLPWIAVGGR